MRLCRRDCLHRQLVESYRDARFASESLRESDAPAYGAAGAAHSGAAAYQLDDAAFRELYGAPTFKEWLEHNKGSRTEPS